MDFSQLRAVRTNIYAQWTKNADAQVEQITVKFVDNFNGTESSAEVMKGEAMPSLPTPPWRRLDLRRVGLPPLKDE